MLIEASTSAVAAATAVTPTVKANSDSAMGTPLISISADAAATAAAAMTDACGNKGASDCRTYSVLSAGTTRASTRRNRASSVAAARRSVVVERRSVVVAVGLLLSAHGPILSALVMCTADLNLRCCCRADAENARTCCGARAQFSSTGRSKHRVHDDLAAQPFLRSTILPPSSARAARIACVAPPVFWLAAPTPAT